MIMGNDNKALVVKETVHMAAAAAMEVVDTVVVAMAAVETAGVAMAVVETAVAEMAAADF